MDDLDIETLGRAGLCNVPSRDQKYYCDLAEGHAGYHEHRFVTVVQWEQTT